jgi:hypothetical protein
MEVKSGHYLIYPSLNLFLKKNINSISKFKWTYYLRWIQLIGRLLWIHQRKLDCCRMDAGHE